MKICLVNHSFPPQIGGGETHIYLLAKGFAEMGHDVLVVTGGEDSAVIKFKEGFTVAKIRHFRDFEKGKVSFCMVLDDLARIFLKRKFDVVHIHNFMPGLAYASIASLVKTKKTMFTFHSTPIPEEGKIIGQFRNYEVEKSFASFVIKLPFYDTLICPSKYYYDWALKLGANKERIKLVYHGVNEEDFVLDKSDKWMERYGFVEDDFVILCPARMIKRKGIIDLVKAIENVNDAHVKLFIPTSIQNGSLDYLDLVNRYVESNNLSDRVKIVVDKVSLELMPQIFASCDVCVLPSHIEGLGIVLLEAMASGIPVIGSNTFGINEVIKDGVNGLLVNPKDPLDLAEKILQIRNNSMLVNKLIDGGKCSVRRKFSLRMQLESLESFYK
jgi:glycosyltransferase involved in cell wall biosynthesis